MLRPARAVALLLPVLTLAACAGSARAPEPAPLVVELATENEFEDELEHELAPEPPPMRPPRALDDDGVFHVLGATPAYPRLRYLDGQVSLNESCAIRVENGLNRKIPPVYVNGLPIGFC